MIFFKNVKSIGWRAFRQLLAFYLLGFMLTGAFIHFYTRKDLETQFLKESSPSSSVDIHSFSKKLNSFDRALIYSFWILTLLMAGFSLVFIRRLLSPLEYLLLKAQSIEKEDSFPKNSFLKKQGEWHQLDIILDKISSDLKKRRAEVQRERGELEAVISAANDAILAVGKDMNIRYYNASLSSFF